MLGKNAALAIAAVIVIVAIAAVAIGAGAKPKAPATTVSTVSSTVPSTTAAPNSSNASVSTTATVSTTIAQRSITTYSGSWTVDPGSRMTGSSLNGVPSAIQLQNGSIRLYYCTSGSNGVSDIVSATSKNGLSFTPDAGTRISDGSTTVCNPSIIMLTNGSYRIYYSTFLANNDQQLYTAISKDGLTFTNPTALTDLNDSSWNNASGFSSEPEVHYAANGTFVMYYNSRVACPVPPGAPPLPSQWQAVSSDGVHFTPTGCLMFPRSFDYSVSFSDYDWAMLPNGTSMYIGDYVKPPDGQGMLPPNAKNSSYYGFYVAYSTNSSLLNYSTPKLIINASWPSVWFSDQDVLQLSNGTYKMYYNAHLDQNGNQGIAIDSATWVPIANTTTV